MIGLYKLARVLAVCAIVLLFLPRPALAQDGCGLLGALFGCSYELRAEREANDNAQAMAQIAAQATATALGAQAQADQLRYQQWLASEQARTELEQIASRERIDGAKIQAELEMMYARERMASVAATTSFNVAALQSDAMIAVASAREREAAANQVTGAFVALAVLALAGAGAFVAWQYRRAVEVQTDPRLLPPDDWQRRAVAMLEQRGIPWEMHGRDLLIVRGEQRLLVRRD
jgi:hypothetical protein